MYSNPSQFEPLLPDSEKREALLERAHALQKLALAAAGRADHSVMLSLAPLLRSMNSYYTNKIEGQHTLPIEIEQAMRHEFSSEQEVQRKQRIALSHLAAEQAAETQLAPLGWRALLSAETITTLHRSLFESLPPEDCVLADGSLFQPGQSRTREVRVGRHIAPGAQSIPAFLDRFAQFYGTVREGELSVLAVAAAHHRLAWVHPFEDGNGRVARLHSHLLFYAMGLTNGIWSPPRGLARNQTEYYARLANADQPRRDDLDGRGNLTESGLIEFIEFFLNVCIDQARFMTQMLDMQTMPDRIAACLAFYSHRADSQVRMEALQPLRVMFMTGEMERGNFKLMTGLQTRTAERLLRGLFDLRLVVSDSPKGKLRFGVPLHALRFYFPALWPEAEGSAVY